MRRTLLAIMIAACGHSNDTVIDGATTTDGAIDATADSSNAVTRPLYNTGDGFYVLDGKLYDSNNVEFRIRGVNRTHWDSPSEAGLAKSGANTVRTFVDFTRDPATNVALIQTQNIAHHEVPMIAAASGNNVATSCNTNTATLTSAVNTFVAQAAQWTALDKYLLVNLANEWGPANSATWRDSYITAIATMRNAGYLGPLVIDSGGCGQDTADYLSFASAVFASDPQKNLIFSFHVYGGMASAADLNAFADKLAALRATDGMVFIFGEFGPGRNIGPSPTQIAPGDIIMAAESHQFGWLSWAWDDNNLGGGASNDQWFSMTSAGPGDYTKSSDLTMFGADVVTNATYGLQTLAKPATSF